MADVNGILNLAKTVAPLAGPVGEGAALAIGIGQTVAGIVKKKKADAMIPAQEDPEQRAMLRYLARQKRAYSTGTANNADRSALRQALASGVSNSFKYGAGSRGLNAMNQMYLQGLMGINAQGIQGATSYTEQEARQLGDISQRKLDLNMNVYDREQARSAQTLQEGKQNLGASLMRNLSLSPNPFKLTIPNKPSSPDAIKADIGKEVKGVDPSYTGELTDYFRRSPTL